MQIIVLDALPFGKEIDLSIFRQFGNLTVYQTTSKNQVAERIKNAEIIITNKVLLGKEELDNAPELKLICISATGYNNIDLEAAKEHNIVVTNVRNYSTESVTQHTFGLLLTIQNSIFEYVNETRNGNWAKSPVFSMTNHPFYELSGKKLGIIGYGTIGRRVAEVAKAFGMQVLVGKRPGVEYTDTNRVDFENLLTDSDVISIHAPLSENTHNLITLKELKMMKPTAILLNVARGGIVNEDDLYTALKENIIRAAAIDVTETEPIGPDNKLPQLPNLLVTPHMAWASLESRQRLIEGVANNIRKFLEGKGKMIDLVG